MPTEENDRDPSLEFTTAATTYHMASITSSHFAPPLAVIPLLRWTSKPNMRSFVGGEQTGVTRLLGPRQLFHDHSDAQMYTRR